MTRKQNTETFFSVADRIGTFLFVNFIWCVIAMTIIGIPFATAGLFAMMVSIVRGRQPEFFRVFIGAIREHWQKILLIALLDIVVGGLLFINYRIFQIMAMDNFMAVLSGVFTVCVTVILVAFNIYVWSFLSLLNLSIQNLFKLSFVLILTYPITTMGITILVLLPVMISVFLPIAFLLFVTVSTSAFLGAKGAWLVLNRHFSQSEIDALLFPIAA